MLLPQPRKNGLRIKNNDFSCPKNDRALLEFLPALRLSAKKMDEREMYYDHCHFTESGSGLVANEIFNVILNIR